MKKNKIHFIGIAGTLTAPLAIALKKLGYQVTGCDQPKIYPPISTLLKKHHLSHQTSIENINPDLVIVGPAFSHFANLVNQFEYVKSHKINYISATEYIAQNIIKPNSILIAGSFGKTTITSLLSWILSSTKLKPSYMFGGQISDSRFPSLSFSNSDWSVVEADESINGLDTQAKFLYYPVKYLILTSVNWEHKDSYSSLQQNLTAYRQLVENVPATGLIIYNQNQPDIKPLLTHAKCPCFGYQSSNTLHPKLFGSAFQNNLAAVETLCSHLPIDPATCTKSIKSFPGVKRRLEIVANINNTIFIDDFAQSPDRIQQSIVSISTRFPSHRILCLFEPHASFLHFQPSLFGLGQSFKLANQVFLTKISFSPQIKKANRVTFSDFQKEIGPKLIYLPDQNQLIKTISSKLQSQTVLIRFSSGGLTGQKNFNQIIRNFKLLIKN